ncbi:glutaredoxin 3 [Brackiella oedipodis]|uniref:glutaredoxin 3 n=1 Tax=Brackiella oedipodis TaxID=124225 RepID=UPI00048C57E9|nr:glutaredoxin 3 [Brackiella oedipodis]
MSQITMYYKPTCPFCVRAEKLLRDKGVQDLNKINIELHRDQRSAMIERAGGRSTVPQIFINDQHIGGCDDLFELDAEGKLDELLKA